MAWGPQTPAGRGVHQPEAARALSHLRFPEAHHVGTVAYWPHVQPPTPLQRLGDTTGSSKFLIKVSGNLSPLRSPPRVPWEQRCSVTQEITKVVDTLGQEPRPKTRR